MSQVQNLPISLKVVDAFLASMQAGATPEEQNKAGLQLIDEIKAARKTLEQGYNRKELTVCNGKLGYVDPKDADRFLRGEIPRLTVYRKMKDARNMGLFFKRPPKFFREHQKCRTTQSRTNNTTTGMPKKRVKRNASSGPKPTKS